MEGKYIQSQHSPAISGHLESSSPEIAQAAFLWEQNSIRKGKPKLCQAAHPPQKATPPNVGCERQPGSSHHPCLWEQLSDPSSVQSAVSSIQSAVASGQCPALTAAQAPAEHREHHQLSFTSSGRIP